jgi:hypothetical protein
MTPSKRFALILALLGSALAGTGAVAATVTATVTADNFYALYLGDADGKNLRFIGRNELGPTGNPGTYNWSKAETWTLSPQVNDVLYIAAWSDNSTAQGLIGQFTTGSGQFLTNLTDGWTVALSNVDLGNNSPAPTVSTLTSFLASASWNSAQYSVAHGANPWGWIDGISHDARWIWGTPNLTSSGSGAGEYQVFRRSIASITPAPVPLPLPLVLFAGPLLAASMLRRRA